MSVSRLEIIGQRGSGGQAPSGTLPAIEAALRTGVTGLEIEVQFTADAVPVIFFDKTLERLAGVKGTIRNQTATELAGYDVGFRTGDRYRGVRLLTVEEAAEMIPGDVDLHIEIRDHETVNAKHLRGLLGILKSHGGVERCLLTSRSEEILASVAGADPNLRRGLRTSGGSAKDAERAAGLGCRSLHPDAGSTRRDVVEACRGMGLMVYPHSANDTKAIRALIDLGVDGVATDQPERVSDALRSRGPVKPAEPRAAAPAEDEGGGTPGAGATSSQEARTGGAGEESPEPRRRSRRRRDGSRRREERGPRASSTAGASAPPPAEKKLAEAPAPPSEPVTPVPHEGQAANGDSAAPTAEAARARRRRGRRGGRREQARRARRAATQGPGADLPAEPIPLEPVEESGEPLELLGEIHAELLGSDAEPAAGQGPDSKKEDEARRRRRRGRRGGKRVQARRRRQDPSGSQPAP